MLARSLFVPLATCAIAGFATSQGVLINVDVGNAAGTYSGPGPLSAPGQNFWNGIETSGSNLLAADGSTATGVSITLNSAGGFSYPNSNPLLADYQYVSTFFGPPAGAISITGLQPGANHVLCVFSAGDKDDQAGVITLNGVTANTTGSLSGQFIEGANYVILEVVSNALGGISGTWVPYGSSAAINGLQILAGTRPPRVVAIAGAESPTVRSPGNPIPVTVSFNRAVSLSQLGGAAIDLDIGGVIVSAMHSGATTGRSLTFTASAPATTTANVQVVANSLRLLGGATLLDGMQSPVGLGHSAAALPNDQISVVGLSVYPPVPGLAESPQYRFRVRQVGGAWSSAFAWFTKCIDDAPVVPFGYYNRFIGGWSHSYCNFEMAENVPVEIEITRLDPATGTPVSIRSAVPHPRRTVRSWRIDQGKAYVRIDRPTLFAVDIDGQMDANQTPSSRFLNATALHGVSIFANPFILDKPNLNDPNVFGVDPGTIPPNSGPWTTLYFKPGVHQIFPGPTWNLGEDFRLRSNRSYYIPGDAIVHGTMNNGDVAADGRNIRVFGHGTLSGERIDHFIQMGLTEPQGITTRPLRVSNDARGCRVEGITFADPANHSCALLGFFNANPADWNYVRWSKTVTWRANGDGISPNGSGFVEDCFLRTQDDGSYIGGLGIRRMVYWADVNGMPLRCDFLTRSNPAPYWNRPLYVEDIDVIYSRTGFGGGAGRSIIGYPQPLAAFPGNTGAHVVFRNITIDDPFRTRLLFGWDLTVPGASGALSGVRFENIRAAARNVDNEQDVLLGSAAAPLQGLVFDDVTLAGEHYDNIGDFVTNGFTSQLVFVGTAPTTMRYRNTSGYGKWYLRDDWDSGVEPANNDLVEHVVTSSVLTVDAPAYAGSLTVSHVSNATVAIETGGALTVANSVTVGGIGTGRIELRDGFLRLENAAPGALTVAAGAFRIERGELRWAGDQTANLQALHLARPFEFANGRAVVGTSGAPTLVAASASTTLYAFFDASSGYTSLFAVTPIVYGSGCGMPALTFAPDPIARPVLGMSARAVISNAPTPIGGAIVGGSNQRLGASALPFSLASIGMPTCDLWQSSEVIGLPVTTLAPGSLQFLLAVPNNPALVGASVYIQGFAFAPGANAAQLVVSNGIAWTIDAF